jgi:dienelactone hydrolase
VEGRVEIALHGLALPARLTVPPSARGVVVFVPGPRRGGREAKVGLVARRLGAVGVGALRCDLRARGEHPRDVAVDGEGAEVELLAVRVLAVTRWLRAHPLARGLPVGYFGDDASAGVALLAAAEDPTIAAVVSGGGGLEHAAAWLHVVRAPTLLIVGADDVAIARSRDTARRLRSEHEIVVVPGSTHPMRDSPALEVVAEVSSRWFVRHLDAERPPGRGRER